MKKSKTDSFYNRRSFLPVFSWLIFMLIVPAIGFAYDFAAVRISLENDLLKWQGSGSRKKIAIVYNNRDRESLKENYNLVKLKKDLSHELLISFDVADPIIVQEIIKVNELSYQQISNNSSILGQFANRAGSSHVLLVDLKLRENKLVTEVELVNKQKQRISFVTTAISPETRIKKEVPSQKFVAQVSEPETSIFQNFNMDFGSRQFMPGQNDSWVYFSPTALVNPQMSRVDLLFWFKDIAEVDIQVVRLRYDIKFLEVLQFGVQTYGIVEKKNAQSDEPNLSKNQGHHSTYLSLKYLMVDDTVIPANIAIGIRKRLLWDNDNTDFRSRDQINELTDPQGYDQAKDRDTKNNKYNELTLQAMVTGKLEPYGLLYNFYLDSQTIGTGLKFVLTPDIKLMFDNVYNYYDEPDIKTDTALGVQFYNPIGSTDLIYQFQTQQVQLGINLDF